VINKKNHSYILKFSKLIIKLSISGQRYVTGFNIKGAAAELLAKIRKERNVLVKAGKIKKCKPLLPLAEKRRIVERVEELLGIFSLLTSP